MQIYIGDARILFYAFGICTRIVALACIYIVILYINTCTFIRMFIYLESLRKKDRDLHISSCVYLYVRYTLGGRDNQLIIYLCIHMYIYSSSYILLLITPAPRTHNNNTLVVIFHFTILNFIPYYTLLSYSYIFLYHLHQYIYIYLFETARSCIRCIHVHLLSLYYIYTYIQIIRVK